MISRGYIGNTDFGWYSFLKAREPDEVNFWQPSGKRGFHAIRPGDLFFFRLKKPHYKIAGFGVFSGHSILPAWLAWQAFGPKNGAESRAAFFDRIAQYRKQPVDQLREAKIGCLMVSNPVWFEPDQWVPEPKSWAKNIVQGKTYDLTVGQGALLYEQCRVAAENQHRSRRAAHPQAAELPTGARYGQAQWVAPRLGQGAFRVQVTEAYGRACAITQEHSLPVLEAAHVRPYADNGPHDIQNGILLRADIHRLFDGGYVTITPDYRFEVSERLEAEWDNGKAYYALAGQQIVLPKDRASRPDPKQLDWHNQHVFVG